jgi:quercetin dioxygenase-like cupin family protein
MVTGKEVHHGFRNAVNSHYRWKDQPSEALKGTIARSSGSCSERSATVPRHSDDNEQFTYVVEGALKFWLGDNGKQEMVVSAWCVRLS